MKNLINQALPWLLPCFLLFQCLMSMEKKSATWDEPVYLSAGYSYLTRSSFDLNREHPPFMKYLSALPLLLMDTLPANRIDNWNIALSDPPQYGAAFLFKNSVDADRMLFWGRCPTVFLSMLTGLLVFLWARQLYGYRAGTAALLFYCFSPNIIAHSRLITLDIGLTFGIFSGCYALWGLYNKPGKERMLLAGLMVGVSVMIKSVGLVFLILIPVFTLWAILKNRRNNGSLRNKTGRYSALTISALSIGVFLTALAVISVGYGPYHFGLKEYLESLKQGVLNRDNIMSREYDTFLWGSYSFTGFPLYFVFAFLVKTPAVTLLFAAFIPWWLLKKVKKPLYNELFLITPVLLFFAITIPLTDNFGLRYILPVYPFLFVLIGGALSASVKGVATKRVVAVLMGWYVISACVTYPDYLSYFNEFVGGGKNGIRYLDDSNIDWGQDMKRLALFVKERGIKKPVKIFYFPNYLTNYVIPYYGEKEKLPRKFWATEMIWMTEIQNPGDGWYAVSSNILQRSYLQKGLALRFDWLDRYEPVAKIGNSIYVYRFGPAETAGTL